MKKTSKFIWALLILSVFVLGLVSCKDPDNTVNGNTPSNVDDEVIYSPYVDSTIVLGEGIESSDITALRNAYFKMMGKEIKIKKAEAEPDSHEIIIGKTDREISTKAYRTLLLNNNNEEKVGYSIYSDGKSVAIAFDEASFGENVAFAEAIDYFVSKYMKTSTLKLNSGVAHIDSFFPIEKQRERDDADIERLWALKEAQISNKLENIYDSEEIVANIIKDLKGLRHIYNDQYNIVEWLANLYDPVSGGFYYSNSARNNEGFAADLGSTSQALGIVEFILMGYGGTLTDYFGEEIAEKFVSFAKNMQDENGYFYHPQWPHELIDKNLERRNIDVLNALNILNSFGAVPTYDTLGGVKGDGGVAPVSKLTLPLRNSKVMAVSQISGSEENEIYIPPHLRSKTAFENYLSELDINSNVIDACKTLNSEISLYIAIDEILVENNESYRLCEILEKYLARTQRHTGFWSYANDIKYGEIEELSGIIKIYNALGVSIPNYNKVIKAVEVVIQSEEQPETINDIASVWMVLDDVVNNVLSYGREVYQDQIKSDVSLLYAKFADLLKITQDKLVPFLRDDGSFSTTPNGSVSEVYGASLAIPEMKEGDMSATLIATKNIYLSVFSVLGIGNVPIFTASDRMMFQKVLLDLGVIVKNEIKKTEPMGFEQYDIGDTSDVLLKDTMTNGSFTKVVAGSEEKGNVLNLYSSSESGQDEFHFSIMSQVNSASCYTYELDMCILPEYSEGLSSFIMLYYYIHMIGFERQGDVVKIVERSNQWSDACINDLGVRAKIGEWFNLRVEYYPGNNETVRVKIYFNDTCVAVTDSYFGEEVKNAVPPKDFTGLAVFAGRKKEMSLLVDNVVIESNYKYYTPETSSNLNINVDTPDKEQDIYDFEDTTVGSTPQGFKPDGDYSAATVKTDADGNKVLSISEKAGEVVLPLDQRGTKINSAVIEFDLTIDANSAVGAKYQFNFNEYMYNERSFGAFQLLVLEEGGSKYATIAEVSSGKTGTIYSTVKLTLGVKYHLRLQIFFTERALLLFVDGDMLGISSNVLKDAEKYYMRETTIEALTPKVASCISIDNLVSERIRSDFEEMTLPENDRVNHGFDTAEGMELSGVSPKDGVLSFANAGAGASYVKIPVNARVNVPTMAVMGFDVTNADGTYGSLEIALTDKSGNVIAKFELVRNGSSVEIYELLKSGRYSVPVHTIDTPTFSFTIEYSPEQEGFNILVDGEYVAASSLTYTLDSGAYDFQYLSIGAVGSAGFVIDNLYAEEICGIFKAQKVSMVNTDGKSDVITYETSSFASLPENIQFIPSALKTSFKIKADKVGESVSKVLEIYSAKGEGGTDHIVVKRTQSGANQNATFFETDMMIKSTGGKMHAVMDIRGASSGLAHRITVETEAPGAPVKIMANDGKAFSVELDVKEGEWFKLRIEYRDTPDDFNYDGKLDCLFRTYINGVMIGEGTQNYGSTLQLSTSIQDVRFNFSGDLDGIVYLDNTALGGCNMIYKRPIPADTDTITYEPGVITNKTQFSLGKDTSTAKISEMTVDGEVTKVLDFHTAKDSSDRLSIFPTLTLGTANAIMFETDIMLNPDSGTSTFYIEPQTDDRKQPFRLIIKATSGGNVTISSLDIPETVIGKIGEWIHIKIEYMNPLVDYTGDKKADILYKVYIGDEDKSELIAKGYQPYQLGAYYTPQDITKYVFTATSESVADIILDNTRFWQMDITPDEPPIFEDKEDFQYGTPGSDYDGWSKA